MLSKKKTMIALCSAIVLAATTVGHSYAYTTNLFDRKTNQGIMNMSFGENLFHKLTGYYGGYNGKVEHVTNRLKMTWTGQSNLNHNHMYFEPYIIDWHNYGDSIEGEILKNKNAVEKVGFLIEAEQTYKLSYEVEGKKLGATDTIVFFCDANYKFINLKYLKSGRNGENNMLFKTPQNAKYMSLRVDPHFNNPISGDYAFLSNVKVQKLLR